MISINWGTKVIFIPKSFLTLVQSTPLEIYELDLNTFRLALKDLEDSEEGMVFLDTHRHNTEVTLAGITYARVIEIINGYTITFEDDQYAVNLVGANSNVADNVNVNQVSVRANNSAGLISSPAIEYSSFEGGVFIDTGSSTTGTIYPAGTQRDPVNNLDDAILIAEFRGFSKLYFLSDYTFDASTYISSYSIYGQGLQSTTLTFEIGCIVAYCEFFDANCTGSLTGIVGAHDCMLNNLGSIGLIPSSQDIVIKDCLISGTISLPSNYSGNIKVLNCWSDMPTEDIPILNMGSSTSNLLLRAYTGGIKIINNTTSNHTAIDLVSGRIFLDNSVTNGTFLIRGVGLLYDSSTGTSVDYDGLISKSAVAVTIEDLIAPEIQYSSFSDKVTIDVISGTSGTIYPIGTPRNPVNNLEDAKSIASLRGFTQLEILSPITITTGQNIDELTIKSENWLEVTIEDGVSLVNTIFEKISLYGFMGGFWNILVDCWVYDITNFCGWMRGGSFENITLATYSVESAGQSFFDNIVPMYPSIPSVLTMNTNVSVSFTDIVDTYQINSMTDGSSLSMGLGEGIVIIDSSCTGGDVAIFGIGTLQNNSTNLTSLNIDGLVNKDLIVDAIDVSVGPEIQYSSYNDGITIDVINGTDSNIYPSGTPKYPCKTLTNVSTIAQSTGFKIIYILGDLTISGVPEGILNSYTFIGNGHRNTTLTIDDDQFVNCNFKNSTLIGNFENGSFVEVHDCVIGTVSNITLDAYSCYLSGSIELNNTSPSNFYNCVDGIAGSGAPVIEVNDCENLGIWEYSGGIKLTNIITPLCNISVNMSSGRLIVDSTDTQGSIIVRGVGSLSGTTGGTTINSDGLIDNLTISTNVWSKQIDGYTSSISAGGKMNTIDKTTKSSIGVILSK